MHFIKTKYWQILDLQENTDKNVGNMEDIVRENLTFIQSESQRKRMNGSEKIVEETVTDYFQCFPEAMKDIHPQAQVAQKIPGRMYTKKLIFNGKTKTMRKY